MTHVNLIDLVRNFLTSIYLLKVVLTNDGFDTAENVPLPSTIAKVVSKNTTHRPTHPPSKRTFSRKLACAAVSHLQKRRFVDFRSFYREKLRVRDPRTRLGTELGTSFRGLHVMR